MVPASRADSPAPPEAASATSNGAIAAHTFAAAAHAAAHLAHSHAVFAMEGVSPITQAITGVLEDTRAEALAARTLPGLARLWQAQHTVAPADGDDCATLFARLSRALADVRYEDPHPWIAKGRALFWRDAAQRELAQADPAQMRALASRLGHDLGQMRMRFDARGYRPQPAYRDDNRWLWQRAARPEEGAAQARERHAGESTRDPVMPKEVRISHEPEWDARSGHLRAAWCTVHESRAEAGEPHEPPSPDAHLCHALRRRLQMLERDPLLAARGQTLDLARAVTWATTWRAERVAPAPRVFLAHRARPREGAAVVLVDASASSADGAPGATPLAQSQAQAAALAVALRAAGWRVAIQAFHSDGRARVHVYRVLDFDEPFDAKAHGRLRALRAQLSTRLGAALRHAGSTLARESADVRVVLVLGDAEAHDIDVHFTEHLLHDARHAVRELADRGIGCTCLYPQQAGSAPARRIFGAAIAPLSAGQRGMLAAIASALPRPRAPCADDRDSR